MKKYIFLFLFLIGCSAPYLPRLSGDCVDRAVMLRQSLKEQGYEVKLVLGVRGESRGHCWVEYKDKNGKWIKVRNY